MKSFNIGNLRIPIPIIQGGMGIGISLSGLASAVANMGGIGVISTVGIGYLGNSKDRNYRKRNIDAIRLEIKKARSLTSGILGVNIMSVLTDFSDMVRTSIEEGIDIIFSGAGLPLDLPKFLTNNCKTKLVPIISSGRAASIICKKWKQNYNYLPDAFVLEGPKAGGHLGFKVDNINTKSYELEYLLAEVLEITANIEKEFNHKIPVIAAGGIFSGNDIFEIIKQGASGVQLGTRFVATKECDAAIEFKNAFVQAEEKDIRIIQSPVGMPGRTIFNTFLKDAYAGKKKPENCQYHCIKSCNPKTTLYCISKALISAYKGNLSEGFAFIGANAAKVFEISTVQQVFKDIKEEYNLAKNLYLNKLRIQFN